MKVNAQNGGQTAPRTLFIGDLHLSAERPDILAAFERFLATQLHGADALYIVGDLFEAWIGDDDRNPFTDAVAAMLLNASQQLPIYFINGNRDFLLGNAFAKRAGLTLLPEVHAINLYGTETLVLHGDLLCTNDHDYQRFRRRWWVYRLLSKILTLKKRRRMADNGRARSKAKTQNTADAIMDVTPSAVEQMLSQYQAQRMIHGHTHRPGIHKLSQSKERIVVGDWYDQDSVLVVTPEESVLQSNPLPNS